MSCQNVSLSTAKISDMTTAHHPHHQLAAASHLDDVPERFICPLTLEIMEHPLMTRAGHSFERSAIMAWLRRNDIHPLTRESLSPRDLVMNGALKAEIAQWKRKHWSDHCDSETEASSLDGDASLDVNQFLFISDATVLEELEARLQLGSTGNAVPTTTTAAATATSLGETTPTNDRKRRLRFFGMRRRR